MDSDDHPLAARRVEVVRGFHAARPELAVEEAAIGVFLNRGEAA